MYHVLYSILENSSTPLVHHMLKPGPKYIPHFIVSQEMFHQKCHADWQQIPVYVNHFQPYIKKKKHPQPEQQMRQTSIERNTYSSTLNPKTNQNQPLRKHPAFNAIYKISINVYQISTINPTNSHTSTTKK